MSPLKKSPLVLCKPTDFTLSSGLRVVHLPSQSPVVYCGIAINAGTRQEAPGEEGLAHLCEHTTFKGTKRRTALQILNCLESVGGDLNAFTNKEDTVFYAAVQREHFTRAVDLLTDIVFNSQYPSQEVAHEIAVVCDEIESYNDTPAELIYDEFENLVFQGHPLGHNILGTRERVQSFTSSDTLRFTHCYYRPDNAVFFVYGDISFPRLVKSLEQRITANFNENQNESPNVQRSTFSDRAECGGAITVHRSPFNVPHHQAHVMLGCRAYSYNDERRMALYLLNNLLGGPGMNARLNLSLRERNALVYTIESTMASYSDTGCWSVYFGCDHHDVKRCLHLVRRELDKLMQHPLSERQLQAAKRQLKGQLAIACDNREQYALDFARHYLHDGKVRDITDILSRIDALTAPQLQDVAQHLFAPDRLQQLMV